MALTTPQLNEVCYIESIPMSSNHYMISDDGLYIFSKSVSSSMSAYELLLTRINDLTDEQETGLKTLLDRHIEIANDFMKLESATVGGISGFSSNPQDERDDIVRRVKHILASYKQTDGMSNANQSWIPVIR